jgi:DNA-binding transcriptional ArsR family regulator
MKEKLTVNKLETAAGILRAMAHPQRIQIIGILEPGKALMVSEIQKLAGLPQAKASHHLGILRSHGVVTAKREGRKVFYALRHDKLSHVIDCIDKCID